MTGDRGDKRHRPAVAFDHSRCDRVRDVHHALDVDIEHPIPIGGLQIRERISEATGAGRRRVYQVLRWSQLVDCRGQSGVKQRSASRRVWVAVAASLLRQFAIRLHDPGCAYPLVETNRRRATH